MKIIVNSDKELWEYFNSKLSESENIIIYEAAIFIYELNFKEIKNEKDN